MSPRRGSGGDPPHASDAHGLVGRADTWRRLRALLDGGVPVVSIVGTPGVGKSALLRVLHRLETGSTPTWLVDLATVTNPAALPSVLAAVGGWPLEERRPIASLARSLRGEGAALLLIDNVELLGEAVRPLVRQLLAEAAELQVVVASRERLDLSGEAIVELGTLSVLAESGERSEAERLWLRVFRDAGGSAVVSELEHALVAEIVAALGGLPLALELTAARCALVGIAQVHHELQDQAAVLRMGRVGEPRHAVLREAIASSWTGLDRNAARAIDAACTFRGGFSPRALERVSGLKSTQVAQALETLRRRSLLSLATGDEGGRYDVVIAVREYAAGRLASRGEIEGARAAHARWVASEATEVASSCPGPGEEEARAWMRRERRNCDAALQWLCRPDAPESDSVSALHLLAAMDRAWWIGGGPPARSPVGPTVADWSAVADMDPERDEAVAEAHRALWFAHAVQGLPPDPTWLDSSLRAGGLPEARARITRATVHSERSRSAKALSEAQLALGLARRCGDIALQGVAHQIAARALVKLDRLERAEAAYERASRCFRAVETPSGLHGVHLDLALLHLEHADNDTARQALQRAREFASPDRYHEAFALAVEAGLDHLESPARSARRWMECRRTFAPVQSRNAALALGYAGTASLLAGKSDEGLSALHDARVEVRELGDLGLEARFRGFEAAYHLAGGRELEARQALAAGRVAEPHASEDVMSRVQSALQGAYRRGRPRTRDAAVVEAILGLRPGATLVRGALTIDAEGRWFELPDGERVDCGRRRVLRRILVALAERHVEDGPSTLPLEELNSVGWPNENVLEWAARNRAYVAVSRLRDLGLRPYLETGTQGWQLSATLEVRIRDRPS